MTAPAPPLPADVRPALPRGVRVVWDGVRGGWTLQAPERALRLDAIGAAILDRIDGARTFGEIVAGLAADYDAPAERIAADASRFLSALLSRRMADLLPEDAPAPPPRPQPAQGAAPEAAPGIPPPIAMLAELTHRCPLSCPYCSNPLELTGRAAELTAGEWADVFRQAAALGVLQLHLSGGEPASRRDLEEIVAAAVEAGLYTNLITSGVGLTRRRLERLDALGLDHVQLSLQGTEPELADEIGGYRGGFARKMQVARDIAEIGFPLTVNAVMHRRNLDRLEETIGLALDLGARRLEVACVQFHGWAVRNRAALLPSRAQALAARDAVNAARVRLQGRMVIDFVPPDYYAEFPKACMGGWGSTGVNIAPDGKALPCHAAETIPGLTFESVRDRKLAEIWSASDSFNAFRGLDWMEEPCASCERKAKDFGGCRCQAQALAGRAAATDPTCRLSPDRAALDAALAEAGEGAEMTWRTPAPA